MYEDTKKKKEVIRSRKSKNDRQYYGQTFDWCDLILIFGVLTPFSVIFQLYHGDQL
jgi:hypothetical protein